MALICPACLNGEVTCEVTTIQTRWRGDSMIHQCLICSGAYKVIIVKRFDKELGFETYMSELAATGKGNRNEGWFLNDDRPEAL